MNVKQIILAILVAGSWAALAEEAPGKVKENSIAVGVTLTDGNSETLLANASFVHDRKREQYRLRLGIEGAYAENTVESTGADGQATSDSETTVENVKGAADYRRNLSERAYLGVNLTALYDGIADIDYRIIFSLAPGYYLMKSEAATLGVDAGPAYLVEKIGGDEREDVALRVAERYDRQLSPTAKTWQALEYLPLVDELDVYLLNAEIGVEAALNNSLSMRLAVKYAYDSTPAEGKEKGDTTVIGALVYQL